MLLNIRYLFPPSKGVKPMGFLDALVTDLSNDPVSYLMAVALLLGAGVVTRFVLKRYAPDHRQITWGEFASIGLIIVFIQVPFVNVGMTELARNNAVGGYQETWGGKYKEPYTAEENCPEDGSNCGPTRTCHPYQVDVIDHYKTVKDPDTYDKTTKTWKRNNSHQEPVYRKETRYHQCPYIKFKTKWMLKADFGHGDIEERTVAVTVPLQPQRFEAGYDFAGFVTPPSAPPAFWTETKAALDRGEVVPAQKVNYYDNPLLAAQADQLENYSDKVAEYRTRRLLVDHTQNVHDPITDRGYANQMVFVQKTPPNAADMEYALARFNTEFGVIQGSLFMVVVPNSVIGKSESEDYTDAEKAWVQSPEYGKVGLPKNAVMIVLGVSDDFQKIEWSQARTGISFGNNAMLMTLESDLAGKPFDPEGLFGKPTQTVDSKGKTVYHPGDGVIEQILLVSHPFKRPCIKTCEAGQDGGFEYVSASLMMTTGDLVLLYLGNILAGGILFFLAAWFNLGHGVIVFGRGIVAAYGYVRHRKWRNRESTYY